MALSGRQVVGQLQVYEVSRSLPRGVLLSQQEVYKHAARDLVRSAFEGINGAVIAYGHTVCEGVWLESAILFT